ncbi:MAG TPA: ABC-2 transporter permease [Ktedonobacteraceae bacterium]|nr:ABC-2 transporter permease [Ktedonobacteraceae bacterium]
MMSIQRAKFFGVVKYEFRMQIRRVSLWITFLCIALFYGVIGKGGLFLFFEGNPLRLTPLLLTTQWTRNFMFLFPVAFGVLLADRLPRDRRRKVEELLLTLPITSHNRLIGKYLGSLLATLLPMFLIYLIGIAGLLYGTHNIIVIPYGLLTFVVIALPGLLFVGAFSIACPVVLWVPLYQLLFVGYWFWGNILGPRSLIPSLSTTILTPIGGYMASGFFGDNMQLIEHATPLQGLESILLLLGISVLVLYSLCKIATWQQERQ